MTTKQRREGHRRFVELAMAIGDTRSLDRIRQGIHPYRGEFIDAEDWMTEQELA